MVIKVTEITQCRCGWCWRFWPQVCSTAKKPMAAPRCFGSAAISNKVCEAALNKRPILCCQSMPVLGGQRFQPICTR
jgi:hypothetical protein